MLTHQKTLQIKLLPLIIVTAFSASPNYGMLFPFFLLILIYCSVFFTLKKRPMLYALIFFIFSIVFGILAPALKDGFSFDARIFFLWATPVFWVILGYSITAKKECIPRFIALNEAIVFASIITAGLAVLVYYFGFFASLFATWHDFETYGRLAGFGYGANPNPFANLMMVGSMSAYGLLISRGDGNRVALLALASLLATLLLSGSRGASSAAITTICVTLLFGAPSNLNRKFVIASALILGVFIFIALAPDIAERLISRTTLSEVHNRAPLMNAVAELPSRIFFGSGFVELTSIVGSRSAHNIFFEAAIIFGLLPAFLVLGVPLILAFYQLTHIHPSSPEKILRTVTIPIVVASSLYGLVETHVYQVYSSWALWMIVGGSLAVYHYSKDGRKRGMRGGVGTAR